MKVKYHSLATSNEKVVIKNSKPIIVKAPNTGEPIHSGFTEELSVRFKNYILETEDPEVIKYMDEPANGCGKLWQRVTDVRNENIKKSG